MSLWMGMYLTLAPAVAAPDASPKSVVEPHVFIYLRPEARFNSQFDSAIADRDIHVWQTVRGALDARQGKLSATVQLQHVGDWGARASSTDASASVSAYQGFVQVGEKDRWLRVGRQEIQMLNGFYLSAAPWNMAGRSFDAVRAHWSTDTLELDIMGILESPPLPESEDLPNASYGDQFGALFATFKSHAKLQQSLWLMGRGGGPTLDDPTRERLWVGPGYRLHAKPDQTEIDLNAMYQYGEDTSVPIRAYSVIARVKQTFGALGVGVIFDQSSGQPCEDEACSAEVLSDFDLEFGRNHFLRGYADQVAGSNARDLGLEVSGEVSKTGKALLQTHLFQLTEPTGRWRRNGNREVGSGFLLGNDDPNLGVEVDAIFAYRPQPNVRISGGYTYFQPIGAGAEIAGEDPMHYLFMSSRFSF